jgi:dTDP-4-dehydrorhamnose reductase
MKILVLGAGGMVGSMMTRYLIHQGYDVKPSFRNDFNPLQDEIPDMMEYDYVVNCIGLIKQKSSDKDLLFALNADLPHRLAQKCEKLIHISSDCVFSGNLHPDKSYSTYSTTDATDDYGQSKAAGEPKAAMVLRTSVIGPSRDNYGLFEWFRHTDQDPVRGFANHWWSGITTLELSKIVDNIVSNNLYNHGTYQISSGNICKYDLLVKINSIFDLRKNIQRCEDVKSVNRTLLSNIQAADIQTQLAELKEWA